MLTALIVDNSICNSKLIESIVTDNFNEIDKIYTCTSIEKACTIISEFHPHILFFNVEFSNDFHSSPLKTVLLNQSHFEIVFITTCIQRCPKNVCSSLKNLQCYKNFSIESIGKGYFNAFRYLTRRAINNIWSIFNNVSHRTKKTESVKHIAVSTLNDVLILPVDEIVYLEADGRYTTIYLNDGSSVVSSRHLKEYQDLLEDSFFFRIHHKYVVNLSKISKINKVSGSYCEFKKFKPLPISKRKQAELLKFLNVR